MNDEAARQGRPDDFADRSPHRVARPAVVITIPLEGQSRIQVEAQSLEDHRRLIDWLRSALEYRESFDSVLYRWLGWYERQEAA